MNSELYTTTQVINIAGEKKERIQYLVRRGAITPVDKGRGVGTTRMYSFGNLLEILLIRKLSPYLNNIDFIKRILVEARNESPSYFVAPNNIEDRHGNDENILTVLIESENAIMVYITGFEKAFEVTNKYLPIGMIAIQIDLSALKKTLFEKLEGGDPKNELD